MSLHIETAHNPRVSRTNVGKFAEETHYEHTDDEIDTKILVLDYDEAVVISGDLEQFARNVWQAVFDTPAPGDAA